MQLITEAEPLRDRAALQTHANGGDANGDDANSGYFLSLIRAEQQTLKDDVTGSEQQL